MDEALSQASLSTLAESCTGQLKLRRYKEPADDRYCLEIFRRAIIHQVDQAWSTLHQCFSEIVRTWLRSHSCADVALLHDTEENYIAQTFSRFWYAVRDQQLEFATLNASLSYLHATLNGIIMDTMRIHLRLGEVSLSDPTFTQEHKVEESVDSYTFWESILTILSDERERRLAYLLYYCGFKPREIADRYPSEFAHVKEIYRLNQNIIERLRRNRNRLRWLLGDEEI